MHQIKEKSPRLLAIPARDTIAADDSAMIIAGHTPQTDEMWQNGLKSTIRLKWYMTLPSRSVVHDCGSVAQGLLTVEEDNTHLPHWSPPASRGTKVGFLDTSALPN